MLETEEHHFDEGRRCSLFQLKSIPHKGQGLLASKDISPGDLIIAEEPLFKVRLTPEGDLLGKFSLSKREFISPPLFKVLNELPDNDLIKFYSLADSCSQPIAQEHGYYQKNSTKCSKTSYGIVKTNSFSIDLSDQRSYLAIFPTISRLNHSCQPNCNHYWSGRQFKVRAIQKIAKNDEITISYMSPLQRSDFHTRESRRKILQDEFGFWCHCNLCEGFTDDEKNLEVNDLTRSRVLQIEQKWCHLGQEPEKALSLAEEQLTLGQKLGLQPGLLAYIALHCVEASSLVFSATQDQEISYKGRQHAILAKSYGTRAYGENSDEVEVFSKICEVWTRVDDSVGVGSNNSNNTVGEDLFTIIQESIAKLRDIDKK